MAEMNLGRIGFVAKGNFDPNKTDYKKLDQVTFEGSSFFARVNNPTGIPAVDNSNLDWQLSAKKADSIVIGTIKPTDPEPTKNGMYIPGITQNEAGTPIVYPNAGGLTVNTAEGGEDYGMGVQLIKEGSVWVKSSYQLPSVSVVNNLIDGGDDKALSAEQGKILNDLIANFSGQIGSGIIGEAFPATIPISEGFGIYTVSTAGTFVNFKDVNDDPLIISQTDLDSGLVQLWGNDNVWDKHITLVDVFTPIFSDSLSDI